MEAEMKKKARTTLLAFTQATKPVGVTPVPSFKFVYIFPRAATSVHLTLPLRFRELWGESPPSGSRADGGRRGMLY